MMHFCRRKVEGLVHISQLRREGRVKNVEEVVLRGQAVKVKVLSITAGQKISLTMKDVDQETGEDLNPTANRAGGPVQGGNRESDLLMRNPERPLHLLGDMVTEAVVRDDDEFRSDISYTSDNIASIVYFNLHLNPSVLRIRDVLSRFRKFFHPGSEYLSTRITNPTYKEG
jgi:hypothetical protein